MLCSGAPVEKDYIIIPHTWLLLVRAWERRVRRGVKSREVRKEEGREERKVRREGTEERKVEKGERGKRRRASNPLRLSLCAAGVKGDTGAGLLFQEFSI